MEAYRSARGRMRGLRVVEGLVLAVLLALGACTTTGQQATSESPTPRVTEPSPEPITPDEEAWLARVHGVSVRIDKAFGRTLNLTHQTMRRLIKVLGGCRPLVKAGSPSPRFDSVQATVEMACKRFTSAASSFRRAIEVSDPGGGTVQGSPEQKVFKRSINRAFDSFARGNTLMKRAEEEGEDIRASLPAA